MRKVLLLLLLVLATPLAPNSLAQTAQEGAPANTVVSGRWSINADFFGTSANFSLKLIQDGNKLTGSFQGNPLEGTFQGNAVNFVARNQQGGTVECAATAQNNTITGTLVFNNVNDPQPPTPHPFIATLVPERGTGAPQRHEFIPTTFSRQFSAANKPALTVSPGDTIHTTTVDAGGTDEKGVTRVLGGNPQTGPFYVETAEPGDTLVVHLTRLRLNRDWASSDDALVSRALDNDLAVKMKDGGKPVRWHLDPQRGVATLEKPGEHLAPYSIPLRPMLGCVAVAPPNPVAAPGTGDSGIWGGNMDFNEVAEGATVYLPVFVPGALLYVGDAHAAQGDGELNGNALETSMDVEFTVDVIPEKRIPSPRVESATEIMAMGLNGSLDDAFRTATSNMAQWLTDDYKLTPSEVAEVLGTSAQYKVSEAADRNAGIVLKINKSTLQSLTPAAK
jgi:acetamidase/formamidase